MDRFDIYIERILEHETGGDPNGGYNFRSPDADPGGETKWGISKRAYPHLNIKTLTKEEAVEIYRKDYWYRARGPELPSAVAYAVLDAAVNSGIGNSIRWLQRAVDVADDGIIGPLTLSAVRRANPSDLVLRAVAERMTFLTKLNNWSSNSRGWMRRIADVLRYAAGDN